MNLTTVEHSCLSWIQLYKCQLIDRRSSVQNNQHLSPTQNRNHQQQHQNENGFGTTDETERPNPFYFCHLRWQPSDVPVALAVAMADSLFAVTGSDRSRSFACFAMSASDEIWAWFVLVRSVSRGGCGTLGCLEGSLRERGREFRSLLRRRSRPHPSHRRLSVRRLLGTTAPPGDRTSNQMNRHKSLKVVQKTHFIYMYSVYIYTYIYIYIYIHV